ncbi:MAG: hypothetical protein ACRDYX_08335 [Egibacteraceae bacterium]
MTDKVVCFADALWRAMTYVSVAQLHLRSNPLLTEPLTKAHVKERPSGHWGTVPGTAFVLSHVGLASANSDGDFVPILGAGHAGVVQISMAWLTGDLAAVRPQFSADGAGLSRLVRSFPEVSGLGSEVSPLLPAGWYLGGQIGGALAFAQGAALDTPGRIVVPVLGDGECETPTTAAAWLAQRVLHGRAAVLPVIHVNGYRMGDRSLLGMMDDGMLRDYAAGLGWRCHVVHVDSGAPEEHQDFHAALLLAAAATRRGVPTLVVLRCLKGWSGPAEVAGRLILGTPRTHKTPITQPAQDSKQLSSLAAWLASYRPAELFTADGVATGALAEALPLVRGASVPVVAGRDRPTVPKHDHPRYGSFAEAVTDVLRHHAMRGDLRVFSPDELESNRLGVLAGEPWTAELLAEEVLLGWLAGWTTTGRRGLLVSYEAFAPLMLTGLVQLLKQRRLVNEAAGPLPSVNLLLTSYGWHNVYTHGDPSLTTALLATSDPAVRVLTPADPSRLAAALDGALRSFGQVNVIVAGKHTAASESPDTIRQECGRGLAVWPHVSADDEPDLVLVPAGDLPAAVVCAAAPVIRDSLGVRIRVVNVHELNVLGDPSIWPSGLTNEEIDQYFGKSRSPVLIVTLGHSAAVWGLIKDRLARHVDVIGWQEPQVPMSQDRLNAALGMNVAGLRSAAERLHAASRAVA